MSNSQELLDTALRHCNAIQAVIDDLAAKGAHGASAAGQSAAPAGVPVDAEHTGRMNRQTYRRQERENRNERPAGKRHHYSGGCFDYTAEAIEPSYPGFDGLGRPRTDADP